MIKHALTTRLWHWVNAVAIIVLFMSGLNISNAHRYLYWGDYGFDPKDAWLSVIRFPGWATIPQYYNLAMARDWHILAAWPFGVGLLFIWIAMLANGHFRRNLATSPADWTPGAVLASVKLGGSVAFALIGNAILIPVALFYLLTRAYMHFLYTCCHLGSNRRINQAFQRAYRIFSNLYRLFFDGGDRH